MHESQRLIAELGHIQSFFESKAGMTVGQGKMLLLNWANVARDAAAMLKEQEAVKPEFDSLDGNVGRWRCGNCHISIGAVRAPYCWHCGKAVKWDD